MPTKGGRIKTKKLRAKNVVMGTQIQGADAKDAADILAAAEKLLAGGAVDGAVLDADELDAESFVTGLQWIGQDEPTDVTELAARVEELAGEVRRLSAAGEAETAAPVLEEAAKELQAPEPDQRKVRTFLKTAAETLTNAAKTAGSATDLGKKLAPLAVGAAKLWELAGRSLGG